MSARWWAVTAAAAVIALAAGVALRLWLAPSPEAAALAEAGERILNTRLPDLSGVEQAPAQWRGQVLVVNFWATWCPPCRAEIPGFIRTRERLGNRVAFLGIAIDDPQQVREFADEVKFNYPILIGGDEALELARAAGNPTDGLPFTLIFDRQGRIAASHLGALAESRLKELLSGLLGQ